MEISIFRPIASENFSRACWKILGYLRLVRVGRGDVGDRCRLCKKPAPRESFNTKCQRGSEEEEKVLPYSPDSHAFRIKARSKRPETGPGNISWTQAVYTSQQIYSPLSQTRLLSCLLSLILCVFYLSISLTPILLCIMKSRSRSIFLYYTSSIFFFLCLLP